jgi:hypothetical protein
MTYTFFTTSDSDEEEEEERYSSFVDLEEFEDEDHPEGFEGLQKGSSLEESSERAGPTPWDPAESFFAYI